MRLCIYARWRSVSAANAGRFPLRKHSLRRCCACRCFRKFRASSRIMSATAFSIFINSRFLRRNFQNADWRKRLRECRIFFGRNLKKIGLYYKFLKILKSTGSLRVSRNQWMGKQWTELSGLIPAESVRVWVYAFFCYGIGSSLIALNLHARRVHSAMPRNLLRGGRLNFFARAHTAFGRVWI